MKCVERHPFAVPDVTARKIVEMPLMPEPTACK
jgi:hypothetical protein